MAIDPKYHYFNQQSKLRIRKLFTSKVLSSQKMTLAIFMEIVIKKKTCYLEKYYRIQ